VPATAAGPSLLQLLVGSEGAFGAITEATLAVRPLPAERRYEGWSFRSFAEGCEAFRAMEQGHVSPDVARLSDHDETRMAMAMSSHGGLTERLGRAYLRSRGHEGGCIAIVGWEGAEGDVARRAAETRRSLRAGGGLALGERPGRSWLRARYLGPYQRDELLGRGAIAETLETATTWSNLAALHDAVRTALREALAQRGTPALVACHVSHLYPSGASLYFTFLARAQRGEELEQWAAAKRAAMDAIVSAGGTITHHHAVGHDHAEWLGAEISPLGVEALRAVKDRLDPRGIMNPGKLLPPG
jgi:alkyldihydroxyacetonephosphate synthase